jgi:O-acetyl-ADP-ribose deacetylase (regulator of RNase III)
MDVNLIPASALELPSSQRVDAIVHDGTTDLQLWPGPGPDRELLETYGPELPTVLDRERERLSDGLLPIGGMLRLHRGKLHCDFLLWIATRPPERAGIAAPAPDENTLRDAVKRALAFVSERHVHRVAFRTLGAGPGALDDVARVALIARAANEYYDDCFKSGRPAGIEHVLVCHPHASKLSAARRDLGKSVRIQELAPKPTTSDPPKKRTSSAPRKSGASRKPTRVILSEDEVARARATADPYDRARTYTVGDFFVHSKFGVGRVEEHTPEGFILVLFEGGDTRRLLHARP